MNCDEVRTWLDAYTDNELDLQASLTLEQHLQTCANCQPIYQNRLTLREALSADSLYYSMPSEVQTRLYAALRKADRPTVRFQPMDWLSRRAWAGAAVAIFIGILVGLGVASLAVTQTRLDNVAQTVLASHVRSLMAAHLTDITSTDQHTVKPWFDGKLTFVPPVIDLVSAGFPLLGGRLDYLENTSVATLVYGSDKHVINLFVWPSDASTPAAATRTLQGYHLIHWTQGQMTYWAVSDLESRKLEAFVDLIRARL